MDEQWQAGFRVDGLIAPIQDTVVRDRILIRGIAPIDSAYVFFKLSDASEQEQDKIRAELTHTLATISQIYSLITNRHTEVLSSSVLGPINSENTFGHTRYPPDMLGFMAVPTDTQRQESVLLISMAIDKYEIVKEQSKDSRRQFLRNAIDYYNRYLGDTRLEEKLIDLIICLESLFSMETQELRLRYSIRLSQFLGSIRESEIPTIFKVVHDLYGKRNQVVHGMERVDIDERKIVTLAGYLKDAIKCFIHIEGTKKDTIKLLDESVYDSDKRVKLKKLVAEAIRRW